MKSYQITGIVSILILIGCVTTLDTKIPSYEIEPVEIVNETDTSYVNEFRMMHPKSSSNTFDMMKKTMGNQRQHIVVSIKKILIKMCGIMYLF